MVSIHMEADLYYRQKGVPKPGLTAQRQIPSVHNTDLVCVHVCVCTEGGPDTDKAVHPCNPSTQNLRPCEDCKMGT